MKITDDLKGREDTEYQDVSIRRIRLWLEAYRSMRGNDQEVISSLEAGTDKETHLRVADLEAVLSAAESLVFMPAENLAFAEAVKARAT